MTGFADLLLGILFTVLIYREISNGPEPQSAIAAGESHAG